MSPVSILGNFLEILGRKIDHCEDTMDSSSVVMVCVNCMFLALRITCSLQDKLDPKNNRAKASFCSN